MALRSLKGLMVPALALVVATAACGGGKEEAPASTASTAPAAAPAAAVDPATAATVTGTIKFEGDAPKPEAIKMNADPVCMREGKGTNTEFVVVGDGGSLQNVFVYVKDGLGNLKFPVPATALVLDQKGCQYRPHVFGVQVGQPIEILNSDNTLHNVHAIPEQNREFNKAHQMAGIKHTHVFSTREVMVPFKCDVHRWMNAYVGVLDHPYYAVTGANGTFELKGLPPGTYTIEAWHEKLGTKTAQISIAAGQKQTLAVTLPGPAK